MDRRQKLGAYKGLRGENKSSLADKAYLQIEEMIVTLRLEPGQLLTEAALMAELDLGRTPVREALQRLAFAGLVTILPRRGVMVTEINHARQLQLLELRREVERMIMRDAARRATHEERQLFGRLANDLDAAAQAGDDVTFMRLDLTFNGLTVMACRNEYAARTMQLMQGLARRFWYQHYREALDLKRCATLHAAVARAIAEGRANDAADASDELIDYMSEFTRASL